MHEGELEELLREYADAWERRDPDPAVELLTETAAYHMTPFRAIRGRAEIREYWAVASAYQREVDEETEVVAVDDDYGVCRFAIERLESGAPLSTASASSRSRTAAARRSGSSDTPVGPTDRRKVAPWPNPTNRPGATTRGGGGSRRRVSEPPARQTKRTS